MFSQPLTFLPPHSKFKKSCSGRSSPTKKVICEMCFLAEFWHKSMVKQVKQVRHAKFADHFCLRVRPEQTLTHFMFWVFLGPQRRSLTMQANGISMILPSGTTKFMGGGDHKMLATFHKFPICQTDVADINKSRSEQTNKRDKSCTCIIVYCTWYILFTKSWKGLKTYRFYTRKYTFVGVRSSWAQDCVLRFRNRILFWSHSVPLFCWNRNHENQIVLESQSEWNQRIILMTPVFQQQVSCNSCIFETKRPCQACMPWFEHHWI